MDRELTFIKLSRKMLDWELFWIDHSATQLWIYLLLIANHEDKKYGNRVIKRGQHLTTYRSLEAESGWSHNTIAKYLKALVDNGCITMTSDKSRGTGGTIITVVNYDSYQSCMSDVDTQSPSKPVCVSKVDTPIDTPIDTKQECIRNTTTTNACACTCEETVEVVETDWRQDILVKWYNDMQWQWERSQELMIPVDNIKTDIKRFALKIESEKDTRHDTEVELLKYLKNYLKSEARQRNYGGNKGNNTTTKQDVHREVLQRAAELFSSGKSECREVPF